MRATALISGIILCLTAPAECLAGAKIIDVQKALAARRDYNPPADEAAAAQGLPQVLHLTRAATPAPLTTMTLRLAPAARAACPTPVDSALSFYAPEDRAYGGRIDFATPAWVDSKFPAGWSENRALWFTHAKY